MTLSAEEQVTEMQTLPGVLTSETFAKLISVRGHRLLRMARWLVRDSGPGERLTRPLVGQLHAQATLLEELLDAYGARRNRQWYPFRCIVAAIKLFSDVSYLLLHIQYAVPHYRLLLIEHDFHGDTQRALDFTGGVLLNSASVLLEKADELGVDVPHDDPPNAPYTEQLPAGRLAADRDIRPDDQAGQNITHLATAFLNLADESDLLYTPAKVPSHQYGDCFPDPVSEEGLRDLQDRFHNLQSMYDTYISATETESDDPDLPVLRGHITVIFHLLEAATLLAHHYERHICPRSDCEQVFFVAPEDLLHILMDYALGYASRYLSCARSLCAELLKRYSELGRVDVPVPRYRGFHVRPSTLVAKVVLHYGSDVQMELEGQVYDANSPIEIFRANEKINAQKRRWFASEIACLPDLWSGGNGRDTASAVREVVQTLAAEGKVVVYQDPLEIKAEPSEQGTTLLQAVTDEIARLQATGQLDIQADLSVTFIGDRRALADLQKLAECGYGEDNLGNNIPLPDELKYLRR